MPWGAAAAAVGSIASSAIGGASSKAAAGKAAKAQQKAAAQSASLEMAQQEQARADQLAHINSGNSAANQLSYLMGLTPEGGRNQGMLGSGGLDAASTLPPQVVAALKSFTSKSPNLAYPDATNEFVNHEAGLLAKMDPSRYASELANLGLSAQNIPQSTFTNAMNGTGATTATGNNGYGDTINPDAGAFGALTKNFTKEDFLNGMDPAYQWDLQQGQDALQRSQSANGGLLSGAAGKAMSDYTTNQASNEYGKAYDRFNTNQTNLYNRLAGISGTGMQGASSLANTGQASAANVGNTITSAGTAQGAGYTAGANAQNAGLQSGIQGLGGLFQSQGFSSLFGGGSGGGASGMIPAGATDLGGQMPWLISAGV